MRVPVPDVVHPRVSDRAGLLGAVELGAVVREQGGIARAAGIGKRPEILNVIHLMLVE
jgi:hypothetical protein